MIPNITFGNQTYGLIRYLLGPGRKNEHTAATLIAGSNRLLHQFSRFDTLAENLTPLISRVLDRNLTTLIAPGIRKRKTLNHVVHISLTLPNWDKEVDETTWQKIANEFMEKMGFIGETVSPCRWIAINHGRNKNGGAHIHIVANKIRANGTRWRKDFSFKAAQNICRELEAKHGLHELAEAKEAKQGARWETPAALNEQERDNMALTEKQNIELRLRRALAIAKNEAEFVRNARRENLVIHPRYERGNKNKIVGYRVKLHGSPFWHAPSKIARDLSLPHLRTHWNPPDTAQQNENLAAWTNPKDIAPKLTFQNALPEPDLQAERNYYQQLNNLVDNWLKQYSWRGYTTSQLSHISNKLAGLVANLANKPGLDNTTHHTLNDIALRLGKNAQYHTSASTAHWRAPAAAFEALNEQVRLINSEQFVPQIQKMMKKLADLEDDKYLTNAQIGLSQSIFQALADVHQTIMPRSQQQLTDRASQHLGLANQLASNEVEYFAYLKAFGYEITKPEYTKKWWHIRHNKENIDYTIQLNDLGTKFKWNITKDSEDSVQALDAKYWQQKRENLKSKPFTTPTPPPSPYSPNQNQGPALGA